MTDCETYFIKLPSFKKPKIICITPVKTLAASKYCKPCSLTSVTMSNAIAPVAAEIIAGRPPTKAITTAIQNEAYNPTWGSTPAMIEKAMASGIRARATTIPARTSPLTLDNQCSLIVVNMFNSVFMNCFSLSIIAISELRDRRYPK